jgi:hypothetical protein
MYLYTFVFHSQYMTAIKQIASDLDAETVKRTYLNSFWQCATVFKLSPSQPVLKNVYLYELDINNPEYEG